MAKNNIVPFITIKDYFDNITYTSMRDYVGDCKICKKKNIKIFEHPCWDIIRTESKKLMEKVIAEEKPTDPDLPTDDEGKSEI